MNVMNPMKNNTGRIHPAAFAAGLLFTLLATSAHAIQDCELNGESVSPSNGNTTAGKTGIMRCKDRDSGVLMREQELKAGKFMGLVRRYEAGKLKAEYSENERGNRHGLAREFAANGQLIREATYDNGSEVGLVRTWYDSGQLRLAMFYAQPGGEQASAEFTERGQLNRLHCGDKPLLAPAADDARWCGFAGTPAPVEFFGGRGALNARSNYVAGKRMRHETFNDNGSPSSLDEITGNRRLQRYYSTAGVKRREVQSTIDGKSTLRDAELDFADSGTLTRDRRWSGGKPVSDTSYYLNGQPRSKSDYGGEGDAAWMDTTEYYDSGKVSSKGRYNASPRGRQLPIGVHQGFSEAGTLVAESTYDDRGRITREKAWNDGGALQRDDAVFEDGSRKAFAR